jgi:vancomycin resistance protein YoaR
MEDTQPVPVIPRDQPEPPKIPWMKILFRGATITAVAVVVFAIFLLVSASLYQTTYAGRVYPGVSAGGLDLSGLDAVDSARQLLAGFTYPQNAKIVFTFGEQRWAATPQELGLGLDLLGTVNNAYGIGRSRDMLANFAELFGARFTGVGISPVVQYDAGRALAYLQRIAAEIERPAQEARLELQGVNVVAVPGQIGRRVDMTTMLGLVAVPIGHLTEGVIPMVVTEMPPRVLDASAQAETARSFLRQDLIIAVPEAAAGDPGPWTLTPATLAQMLAFREVTDDGGTHFLLALDENKLAEFLRPMAATVSRTVENARYHFIDSTGQLELFVPSRRGRELSLEKTIQSIQVVAAAGGHQAALAFDYTEPAVGDSETAAGLGISGLLPNGIQWTSFKGSADARIHNITLAAGKFDGHLVAPNETFSMGQHLGDVSFDTGYAEALIILGNRTIKGAGGGVCQVSTTLFRTVFMTGFPVVERHAHAYRVGYYENYDGPVHLGAGFDATVFFPDVDFKFVNDSPYWILMETDVDRTTGRLTWRFYSTSDGRSVSYSTSGIRDEVPAPDPRWDPNPALAPNEVKQVDWAVPGANVYVTRTVTRNGQTIIAEPYNTHYIAWAATCQYNPDTPPAAGASCPP